MYKEAVCIFFLFNGYVICASSVASSWIHLTEDLKNSLKRCPEKLEIFDCLRQSSLTVFDKITKSDIIPITLDVRLVRNDHEVKKSFNSEAKHNKSMERSDTSLTKESWSEHVLLNIVNLFRTHSLDIDYTQNIISGRGRHRHRNQMLPMMIFGVTALGVVTIPMGFQFLSVVAGKALLLAKMALVMATINGLKRVASSGVHYGLYHTDQHHQHGYNYLDRGDINRPRSIKM